MSQIRALPDVAEGHPSIERFVPRVGIRGFEMPVCGHLASISVYVSLDASKKGISMSRIPISLYACAKAENFYEFMDNAALTIADKVGTDDVYIRIATKLPFDVTSLVSELHAVKYYPMTFEIRHHKGACEYYITSQVDYSSACPCSQALAADWMNANPHSLPVSHSQRSYARSTIKVASGFDYRRLINAVESKLETPTQILVKREDEQMFAVLNGKHPKFVEDAVRLMHDLFDRYLGVEDFVVCVEHEESLHPSNAVAVSFKGLPGGLR